MTDKLNFYINTKLNLLKEVTRQKNLFESEDAYYKQVTKLSTLINCAQSLLLNRLLTEQTDYIILHNSRSFFGVLSKEHFLNPNYTPDSYLNRDNGHIDRNGKITWKNPPRSTTF